MRSLALDLKFGLRLLRKSPAVSVIAVFTFALGIGVNIVIFSVVDAIALRPLNVPDADRIVRIYNQDPAHLDRGSMSSWIELAALRAETGAFVAVTAADRRAVIVREGDESRLLLTNVVADNYFDVFRVGAAAGRTFTPADARPGASPLIVLSYDYWQRRYGADPGIIGQTVIASDVACTVIGVLPRGFRGTELFLNPEIYLPLSTWLAMAPGDRVRLERPQSRNLEVFGRMRPGISPSQAVAALAPVQRGLADRYPEQESGRRFDVKYERESRGPQSRAIAAILAGIAALVLMIACVNVANLLLVRGEARRLEIATRLALGASRLRAMRQLAVETLLLAAIGAAAAAVLAGWIISVLPSFMPEMEFRSGFDFRLDTRGLLFAAAIALAAGLLAGVLPAFSANDVNLASSMKTVINLSGSRRGWWRDGLVAGQIAIAVTLLVASGLLLRTLIAIRELDPGFDTGANVLIARLDTRKLPAVNEHAYFRAAIERLRATPGITAAAVASRIPLWGSGGGAAAMAWVPGLPASDADGKRIGFAVVSPGYFSTLGTRILRGRSLSDRDHETAPPVAIFNQSAANLLWPGQDAVGRRFRLNGPNGVEVEVVGIAQDGRYLDLTEPQRAYMFLPLYQEAQFFGNRWGADVLIVQSTADATAQARTLRAAVTAVNPNVTLLSTTTMARHVRSALFADRLITQLATTMGALGLILAVIGLFGVVSYSVTRRTMEIGVRIALGASRSRILRMVVARASILAGIGIALGVGLSLTFGHLLSSVVYGVSLRDPATFLAVVAVMTVVTLGAAAVPAARAARIDPTQALRTN